MPWKRKLQLTERYKIKFQVFETFSCSLCKFQRTIHRWPKDEDDGEKKPGGKINLNDECLVHADHGVALTIEMLSEFFDQAGIVHPGDAMLANAYKRRKEAVKVISEEQLRMNRVEHNRIMLEEYGSKFVVKHTDSDGIMHCFCSSAVSADGGGLKRSYKNRHTGKGHCTVVYSLLTNKPLAVQNDQKSCGNCQRAMTAIIKSGKKPDEITEDDLRHPGKKCYRTSKWSPAVAEEHAMEDIGKYLLIDPKTGKFRPDEEAILAKEVCTDGDTKGCNRFIKAQTELVPEFLGTAVYMPDIGHFVKCISGGLHDLVKNCKELKGKSLLDEPRIKCIIADVS